ncbi:hypothetical protein Taro_003939, partial [Colocasia esculenta]|nr:hypothetical protein [Colocasia esculenta]
VQRLFAKMVSTHPIMVSTQHLRLKGKKIPGISLPRSTQDEGRSTLDLVPRTTYFQNWDSRSTLPPEQVWDSVSTPPPRQVDTLRKNPNLRWMIAMCHPRAM